MKTQFKIIYIITPHSKRVCSHGLECPYSADIFTPSLFFIKPDYVRRKLLTHIICPCCTYAAFITGAFELEKGCHKSIIKYGRKLRSLLLL